MSAARRFDPAVAVRHPHTKTGTWLGGQALEVWACFYASVMGAGSHGQRPRPRRVQTLLLKLDRQAVAAERVLPVRMHGWVRAGLSVHASHVTRRGACIGSWRRTLLPAGPHRGQPSASNPSEIPRATDATARIRRSPPSWRALECEAVLREDPLLFNCTSRQTRLSTTCQVGRCEFLQIRHQVSAHREIFLPSMRQRIRPKYVLSCSICSSVNTR